MSRWWWSRSRGIMVIVTFARWLSSLSYLIKFLDFLKSLIVVTWREGIRLGNTFTEVQLYCANFFPRGLLIIIIHAIIYTVHDTAVYTSVYVYICIYIYSRYSNNRLTNIRYVYILLCWPECLRILRMPFQNSLKSSIHLA